MPDGTEILERLSELGRLEEYAEAIDSDALDEVARLLSLAGFGQEVIAQVVAEIEEG